MHLICSYASVFERVLGCLIRDNSEQISCVSQFPVGFKGGPCTLVERQRLIHIMDYFFESFLLGAIGRRIPVPRGGADLVKLGVSAIQIRFLILRIKF